MAQQVSFCLIRNVWQHESFPYWNEIDGDVIVQAENVERTPHFEKRVLTVSNKQSVRISSTMLRVKSCKINFRFNYASLDCLEALFRENNLLPRSPYIWNVLKRKKIFQASQTTVTHIEINVNPKDGNEMQIMKINESVIILQKEHRESRGSTVVHCKWVGFSCDWNSNYRHLQELLHRSDQIIVVL